MNRRLVLYTLLALSVSCLVSCRPTPVPKPRAYMRIAVPEKEYAWFDGTDPAQVQPAYPFAFQKPVYVDAVPVADRSGQRRAARKEYANTTWLDLNVPSLNATIYLSHVSRPDLDSCISNTLFFIQRHMPKAIGMDEREINEPGHKRYGWLYHIKGRDVASPYQFYLTDSARHFVRGSLYINCTPNNDSLAPVLQFLKTDLDTMLATWVWR